MLRYILTVVAGSQISEHLFQNFVVHLSNSVAFSRFLRIFFAPLHITDLSIFTREIHLFIETRNNSSFAKAPIAFQPLAKERGNKTKSPPTLSRCSCERAPHSRPSDHHVVLMLYVTYFGMNIAVQESAGRTYFRWNEPGMYRRGQHIHN